MRQFHFDFYCFFFDFWDWIFLNGFPNPFIVPSGCSFLISRLKFFELYVRTCRAIFLQFKENELFWGAVFFTTRRGVLEKSFLINFIGVNFEVGNETRENVWSDFVAEQNEGWSEKSDFLFISLYSREREIKV